MFPAICPMMNKMLEDKNGPNTACGEGHILELWAVNGTLDSESQVLVNALSDKVHTVKCMFISKRLGERNQEAGFTQPF